MNKININGGQKIFKNIFDLFLVIMLFLIIFFVYLSMISYTTIFFPFIFTRFQRAKQHFWIKCSSPFFAFDYYELNRTTSCFDVSSHQRMEQKKLYRVVCSTRSNISSIITTNNFSSSFISTRYLQCILTLPFHQPNTIQAWVF